MELSIADYAKKSLVEWGQKKRTIHVGSPWKINEAQWKQCVFLFCSLRMTEENYMAYFVLTLLYWNLPEINLMVIQKIMKHHLFSWLVGVFMKSSIVQTEAGDVSCSFWEEKTHIENSKSRCHVRCCYLISISVAILKRKIWNAIVYF